MKRLKKLGLKILYNLNCFMKKGLLLLIIFFIFIISSISFILILNYLDPFEYMILSISLLIFTFIFWLSSFLTLIFYFFKKVYFRWNVYISNILSSFRQWFLFCLYIILIFLFNYFWIWFLSLSILLFIFFILIELLIQNLFY